MIDDIVPHLLKNIENDFTKSLKESQIYHNALKKIEKGIATYGDANDMSIEIGGLLSKAINKYINADVLPDGKMYYNIASRLLNATLVKNYDLISKYGEVVQRQLNQKAKIHLKSQVSEINQDKINGLINKISNEEQFDNVKWLLEDPIVTFSQSIVDDMIEKNVKFHYKVGLSPKIIRLESGNCCAWCKKIAGTFNYPRVPKDVYKRHANCRCTVTYDPENGKTQNIWDKTWRKKEREEDIKKRKDFANVEEIKTYVNKIKLEKANYHDIIEIGKRVNDYFDVSSHVGDKEKLKEIFSNFRDMGGFVPTKMWAKGASKIVKQQLEHAFSYYPSDWANIPNEFNRQLYIRKGKRGFFNTGAVKPSCARYDTKMPNYADGYLTIVTNGERKSTAFHEIGHMIEWSNPEIVRLEKEWINYRTAGEEEVSLRELFPISRYRYDEKTKKDNFISPYIGKYYEDAAEVLSMGLQGLFEPSETFVKFFNADTRRYERTTILDDPEFLNLTIGLILKG